MDNSWFPMFFIVQFKIIDFAVEVLQKSTFRKNWKIAILPWWQPMINIARICAFKSCTIRSRGIQKDSNMPLTQKANLSRKSKDASQNIKQLQRETQFSQVKNEFEATHSDSIAKTVTYFLISNLCNPLKMHRNFPYKLIMRSPKKQVWCKLASKWQRKKLIKLW